MCGDTLKDDNSRKDEHHQMKYNKMILRHFYSCWILISREELKNSQ